MPRLLEHVNFARVVTVLVVIFGIALGACGLTLVAAKTSAARYMAPFALLELVVIVLSAVALVLAVAVWIVVAAVGDRAHGAGPQKLFDDSDRNQP